MVKHLPIKIFRKRDNDKRLNNLAVINSENSGNRFKLQGDALSNRASHFNRYFSALDSKIKAKAVTENYLPTIVRLKLNSEALAKTYRSELGKIFNMGRKVNIIGLVGEDQLLIKIDNINDLLQIKNKITDFEKNALAISAIEEAEDFKPEIALDISNEENLKIKLINYGDYKLNEIAERSFERLCDQLGIQCKKLNYSKDVILYQISNLKPQELTNFQESESIFSISKVPVIRLVKSDLIEDGSVEIKKPQEGVDYFKIGVFDEGISDTEHLAPWKYGSYNAFNDGEYNNNHGTFIAGIINYGDTLQGKNWTGTKPFKITEAIIFPNDKFGYIDEPMMVDFMKEAVKKYPEIKVWNFSIGNGVPIDDMQYSDFAKFLDDLQDEYNILIVKAAGNCDNFIKAAPRGRITQASESIRTLVIGSIAHEKGEHDLAGINHPSPFSMVGPGVNDVIKPDLVHYGGNAGVKAGKVKVTGVKSFTPDGKIASSIGTSYSTPRVAALAAELAGSLKEEFNPLLIKALLIHSANHPQEFDASLGDRINQIGFGLPSQIGEILYNDPNEVTLILMDSVDKGSHIKIMDFPYPASLIEDGKFYGQIKITLVTSPLVDLYQGGEYIQSDVDVAIGTYAQKKEVDSKINRNPIDITDPKNLLLPSLYSTIKQKSATSLFKSERFLRSYKDGHKDQFLPVKKWCVDLEELRESSAISGLNSDRHWFLKLEASYRNNFDIRMKDSRDISQEFALVVTIKDTKGRNTVYDEVTNLLSQYNFLHDNIKLNERINVN